MLNVVGECSAYIRPEGIRQFYQVVSKPDTLAGPRPDPAVVVEELHHAYEFHRFLFLLQVVLELPFCDMIDIGLSCEDDPHSVFLVRLQEAIRMSEVDVELTITPNQAVIHPRGDPELEKRLVEEVGGMLRDAALKHFVAALTSYGKGTPAEHVKSAESLRRCLEEFLRQRLSNSKGLDANIAELLRKLKVARCDSTIRSIIFTTFSCLDRYFNENSKHADGDIDAAENEYLIYQTGLLVRYVDRALTGQ